MIQIRPCNYIADVIQALKGETIKVNRQDFLEIDEYLWGDSFWPDGYFTETGGGKLDETVMIRYFCERSR